MRKTCVIWIVSVAIGVLSMPSAANASWYVATEQILDYTDMYHSGTGYWDHDADTNDFSWAWSVAEIEYGVSNVTRAYAKAQYDWKAYVVDYDPETDPPLNAHVTLEGWVMTLARYELEDSIYSIAAIANGSVNSSVELVAGVITYDPDDGDVDSDYFTDDIDVSYNGATVYLGELAVVQAYAHTTYDKVRVEAYAECVSACQVEEQ